MQPLRLDYQATGAASPRSLAILLCGLTLAGAALLAFQSSRQQLAQLQGELAAARDRAQAAGRAPAVRTGQGAVAAAEISAANAVTHQLNFPWAQMFGALEAATPGDIALLHVEPDLKASQVRLTAESRSARRMVDYLRRLQQTSLLTDVVLEKHEIQAQDPDQPLRFTAVGSWRQRE